MTLALFLTFGERVHDRFIINDYRRICISSELICGIGDTGMSIFAIFSI
jgi:hypothetical protein